MEAGRSNETPNEERQVGGDNGEHAGENVHVLGRQEAGSSRKCHEGHVG
jgi:hypothetical protein